MKIERSLYYENYNVFTTQILFLLNVKEMLSSCGIAYFLEWKITNSPLESKKKTTFLIPSTEWAVLFFEAQ